MAGTQYHRMERRKGVPGHCMVGVLSAKDNLVVSLSAVGGGNLGDAVRELARGDWPDKLESVVLSNALGDRHCHLNAPALLDEAQQLIDTHFKGNSDNVTRIEFTFRPELDWFAVIHIVKHCARC